MEYMGTRIAAEKWGYPQAIISDWCRKGMIEGAEQDAKRHPWRIPINAKCPNPIKSNNRK